MKLYFWQGGDTDLGRFGKVKKGDPLVLTNAEASYVERQKDRNFKRAKADETFPENAPESLKREAHPDRIENLELEQSSYEELVERAEKLKRSGLPISFDDKSGRHQLISAIKMCQKQRG